MQALELRASLDRARKIKDDQLILQLKQMASDRKLPRYSGMSKAELIGVLFV